MRKVIIQASLICVVLVGVWFLVASVDWVNILGIQKIFYQTEQKIGDLSWEMYASQKKPINDDFLQSSIDSLFAHICQANHIDQRKIKLHLVKDTEVNAFALPGNHIVINSGLILASHKEEELGGVVSHEIAHLELSHVRKKIFKQLGIGLIVAILASTDATGISQILELLTSTAYDRSLEKDADIQATAYLVKANVNPYPFADFLDRLDEKRDSSMNYLSWISTHPNSKERATYIREIIQKNPPQKTASILGKDRWDRLKSILKKDEE